ncbi:hypothetical protein Tco_1061437, partial [Tanacetum coccineum]
MRITSGVREDLDRDGERGFDCLTFALVSSKAHREGCRASREKIPFGLQRVGLRTGAEGKNFKSYFLVICVKDTIAMQRYGLSAKELNEFLSSYPIPTYYDVILPTSIQTIFDAPAGFFNLCRADSWLTFQKRFEKHIPNLLSKVITRIEAWHERFFFVQGFIISSKYPQLLLDENKLNLKSFKDKLPPNIDKNPYFQRLGRYPTSVRVFNDPILFLAGPKPLWEFGQQRSAIIVGGKKMDFRNFIYTEDDDDDLAFLPKEPSSGFGTGAPSALVNTELPKDVEELEVQSAEITTDLGESPKAGVFIVPLGGVVSRIKERKCKMKGGSSRPPVKRKLASGSSSSRVVRAKTSA